MIKIIRTNRTPHFTLLISTNLSLKLVKNHMTRFMTIWVIDLKWASYNGFEISGRTPKCSRVRWKIILQKISRVVERESEWAGLWICDTPIHIQAANSPKFQYIHKNRMVGTVPTINIKRNSFRRLPESGDREKEQG